MGAKEPTNAELAEELAALLARQRELYGQSGCPIVNAEISSVRHRLCERFAASRGWRSGREFSLRCLSRGTIHDGRRGWASMTDRLPHDVGDHPYYFRTLDRRAAGIAVHLYDVPKIDDRRAASRGLRAEFPDFPSWWYPGRTTLLLWTRAGCSAASPKG
jgi:hypothetical protein